METLNWEITTGCGNLGGGCESCPSLLEYQRKGWDYSIQLHENRLTQPTKIKEPTVFTVSLGSDLFHESVPDEFIKRAFDVMNYVPEHTFEVITKRAERLVFIAKDLEWTPNISMGVTVESEKYKWRIDCLREVPAVVRFVSFLPVLGPVGKLNLDGIHIAGMGGEDWGLNRPCESAWLDEIERQCLEQGVEITSEFNMYSLQEN